MKKYELTYLLSPELKETETQDIQTEIESFITGNEGEIINTKTDPTKRDLGIEIDKKKSARMSSILFTLSPINIAELERLLKGNNEIMRHILVNKLDIKDDRKRNESKFGLERKPLDKVEFKEIDKKIEEILSE